MRIDSTCVELRAVLTALGFTSQQTADLLEQGVTVEQLRGMWQLRQFEGASPALLAEIATRIERIAS